MLRRAAGTLRRAHHAALSGGTPRPRPNTHQQRRVRGRCAQPRGPSSVPCLSRLVPGRRRLMHADDYAKLIEDLEHELLHGTRSVAVLRLTTVTLRLLASLAPSGLLPAVKAVSDVRPAGSETYPPLCVPVRPVREL